MLSEHDHRLLHARDHGLGLEVRCRAVEAMAVVEGAVTAQGIEPGMLTLGTDNGSAFTARRFRALLRDLGVAHRRGGYRDPESQAFIESWFRYLEEPCTWRNEFETIDDARAAIAATSATTTNAPHSGLDYRTPKEVRQTWEDAQDEFDALHKQAA